MAGVGNFPSFNIKKKKIPSLWSFVSTSFKEEREKEKRQSRIFVLETVSEGEVSAKEL